MYKTLGVDNLLRCKVFTDPAACELSVGLFLRLGADQIADTEKLGNRFHRVTVRGSNHHNSSTGLTVFFDEIHCDGQYVRHDVPL